MYVHTFLKSNISHTHTTRRKLPHFKKTINLMLMKNISYLRKNVLHKYKLQKNLGTLSRNKISKI